MDFVDLKERYGKRYRVLSEDGNGRNADPWLWIIPCKHGHLYVHSADRLGAATTGRRIGQTLARLPKLRVEQDAADGYNLSFAVELFDQVAAVMRPRRRRQLTPDQREAAVERLRGFAFAARQSDRSAVEATIAA